MIRFQTGRPCGARPARVRSACAVIASDRRRAQLGADEDAVHLLGGLAERLLGLALPSSTDWTAWPTTVEIFG